MRNVMTMKIALVHDWFTLPGGAEKVVEELITLYPDCDIFSLIDVLDEQHRDFLKGKKVRTSKLGKLPFVESYYRMMIPFWVREIERFDLSEYDLIISSAAAFSKGVITGPEQLHISYIHSPPRYAWDLMTQYLRSKGMQTGFLGIPLREMLHKLRLWDFAAGHRPDYIVANSQYIARRIKKTYRRDAKIIYPPVDIEKFAYSQAPREDFFVTACRFVPYKRVDLILKAFAKRPNLQLIVIGSGPEEGRLKKIATKNVKFVGRVDDPTMVSYFQRARAFVYAAEEDFGILPVEVQSTGTPVIALGKGGAMETVRDLRYNEKGTGILFDEQTATSLMAALDDFLKLEHRLQPIDCRTQAERFSSQTFRTTFKKYVNDLTDSF